MTKWTAQVARFDKTGAYVGGTIAFNTVRKNTGETPRFTIQGSDGTYHGFQNRTAAQHAADYPNSFSTSGPDNLVLSVPQIAAQLSGGYGNRFTVTAMAGIGRDATSVVRADDGVDGFTVSASSTAVIVQALYTGVVKNGFLPKAIAISARRSGVDLSAAVVLTVTTSPGLSATASGNVVTLTGATSSGTITIGVTYGGTTIAELKVSVTLALDPAPPQSQTSSVLSYVKPLDATSYGSALSGTLLLQTGANGSLAAQAVADYPANGNGQFRSLRLAGKLQYRLPGGSWADFGSEVTGDLATFSPGEPDPAMISISQSVGGLTVGQTYEVQATFRISDRNATTTNTVVRGQLAAQVT